MRRVQFTAAALLPLIVAAGAFATDIVEPGDGEFSNDPMAPTEFSLTPGDNHFAAISEFGDREFVHITVPAGFVLSAVFLDFYFGEDETAFFGMTTGSVLGVNPDAPDVALLLGYTHFGPAAIPPGEDLLPSIGTGFGAIGFTPPLAAGDYTLWLQQLGSPASYGMNFVVTEIPAPGAAAALLALGAMPLARRRR